jgi:hypothetical protein
MRLTLSGNAKTVIDQLQLDSREYGLAVMRALNRTADGLQTDASREIRKTYQIKAKDLTPAFRKEKATLQHLAAFVEARGRPLPLYDFAARQNKTGVSVAIKKGNRKTLKHAFIARMPSGHVGVFMRNSGKRLPIEEKYTLSVPGMLTAQTIAGVLEGLVTDRFEKALEQNVRFLTRS